MDPFLTLPFDLPFAFSWRIIFFRACNLFLHFGLFMHRAFHFVTRSLFFFFHFAFHFFLHFLFFMHFTCFSWRFLKAAFKPLAFFNVGPAFFFLAFLAFFFGNL